MPASNRPESEHEHASEPSDTTIAGSARPLVRRDDADVLDSTHKVSDATAANASELGLDQREDDDEMDSGDAFATGAYDSALGQDPGELNARNPGEADLPEATTDDGADTRSR